jgi:hypothetical protein
LLEKPAPQPRVAVTQSVYSGSGRAICGWAFAARLLRSAAVLAIEPQEFLGGKKYFEFNIKKNQRKKSAEKLRSPRN